ncbi:hypothetical protein NLG97_g7339 [Lecanicillium saksenae]|uniref:Uncharacterized protein n=1 Tax=Lecanicillium saksenae TaxID=468837 RepID=A0ACC1QM75_9HYPO|nr:hypothetical protein NLG97_g7339 [Lecanicillium saksenae]
MNALLASIFSPLKESTSSRNGQALNRLEGIATQMKKRGPPGHSLKRKSVSFDMTPKAQIRHTPPKSERTPVVRERRELPNTRKRKASLEILEDSRDVDELVPAPTNELGESTATPEPAGTEPETATDSDNGEFTFKNFVDHRWDGDSIQIQVEWENGQRTWEPETTLHHDARQTLLRYWAKQPGGRPDNPREPGLYEILAIRKHSRDRKRLFVEWVGYGPKENTWEPRDIVQDAAPDILDDYWDSLPPPKRRRVQ